MKFDWKILLATGVVAIILLVVAYFRGVNIFKTTMSSFSDILIVLPIIILTFISASLILQLLPNKILVDWLSASSGIKGWTIGAIVGCITPGVPVVDFPIVMAMLKKGVGIGVVVSLMVASRVWNLQQIPIELGILGWKVTAVRWGTTLLFPILAGFISQYLCGRFFEDGV